MSEPIVDTHLHLWHPEAGHYQWLAGAPDVLNRPYELDDSAEDRAGLGITGVVLVQADDDDADTEAMLAVAEASPEVMGVVGYVPLHEPDVAVARLAELHSRPALVGIRNLIHDRPDPDWVLRPDVTEGLALVERAGLPFDLVTNRARHLDHIPTLGERFGDLTLVIDHLGKPPIGESVGQERWREQMRIAASNPKVVAKLSGLYGPDSTPVGTDELRGWIATALELFGPDRLMVGSDWPVSELAGGYRTVTAQVLDLVAELAGSQAPAILSGTARRTYGL